MSSHLSNNVLQDVDGIFEVLSWFYIVSHNLVRSECYQIVMYDHGIISYCYNVDIRVLSVLPGLGTATLAHCSRAVS
jgi:hypothetical protein